MAQAAHALNDTQGIRQGSQGNQPSNLGNQGNLGTHHALKIGIGRETPPGGGIVRCRRLLVREKLLRFLFGAPMRLTILVPGDSVQSLSITEVAGAFAGEQAAEGGVEG
jgi:hypothetical protein